MHDRYDSGSSYANFIMYLVSPCGLIYLVPDSRSVSRGCFRIAALPTIRNFLFDPMNLLHVCICVAYRVVYMDYMYYFNITARHVTNVRISSNQLRLLLFLNTENRGRQFLYCSCNFQTC